MNELPIDEKEKGFVHQKGRIYFTGSGERLFFLVLTVATAVLSIIHGINTP
jgi:hypothetical protein